MNDYSPVVLLESGHDRGQFDCGVETLNIHLKQYALQNQKKGTVRNYVTCRDGRVVAYYSFAYGSVAQTDAPPKITKGIGKYPVPVMLLARLAVDLREKGKGLGKALLLGNKGRAKIADFGEPPSLARSRDRSTVMI